MDIYDDSLQSTRPIGVSLFSDNKMTIMAIRSSCCCYCCYCCCCVCCCCCCCYMLLQLPAVPQNAFSQTLVPSISL